MTERGLRLVMVEPDPEAYQMAYNVVSNSTLWFAHHHLFDAPRRPRIDRRFAEAWDAYREVNLAFVDTICKAAGEGAVVLVQDYHLTLVPGMLGKLRPDPSVVHFSHTPFGYLSALGGSPTSARKGDDRRTGWRGRVRLPQHSLGIIFSRMLYGRGGRPALYVRADGSLLTRDC